jgi:hypothetical protein
MSANSRVCLGNIGDRRCQRLAGLALPRADWRRAIEAVAEKLARHDMGLQQLSQIGAVEAAIKAANGPSRDLQRLEELP